MARGQKHIPGASYRLQFNRGFTFSQAAEIMPYLHDLGVTDCYASPIYKSAPESTHGYDVCDFGVLNPELGGEEGFGAFTKARRKHGLGLLVDIVPNHMGNHLSNPFWYDVLKNGLKSKYARWFDINWEPAEPGLRGRVLLPVLGDRYYRVLAAGELKVVPEPTPEDYTLAYFDRRFPLSPKSLDWLKEQLPNTPLETLNGQPGKPDSFDLLHALISQQHYRLAYWRVGPEQINYRRFFEVTELSCLRIEDERVFSATHKLTLKLVRKGTITGLRIDHPDGLWDPKGYFARLQESESVYVVVEKILTGDEPLPKDWPVEGTTGYDFLNRVNGLFVDGSNLTAMDQVYRQFSGSNQTFKSIAYAGKKRMLEKSLISELNGLTRRLSQIAGATRSGQDFSESELRTSLLELISTFPVYRTYLTEESVSPSAYEAAVIQEALTAAKTHAEDQPALSPEALDFIADLLLLKRPPDLNDRQWESCRTFVMRFQQLTGPVMAKGLEDTAFYVFHRLASLNEVGGDPQEFGITPDEFHAANARHLCDWPHTLLATATHDTKRGEDARARINVLSEMPQMWAAAVNHWREQNVRHKTSVANEPAPDANDEYLLYQVLTGTWLSGAELDPAARTALVQRFSAYFLKAIKEAKRHTTWTEPNEQYEQAATQFVENILADSAGFLADFLPFQHKVSFFGWLNSLSQLLLKLTSPGVPDIYQGTELWDFTLVDPDNRRPVDYALRGRLLTELQEAADPSSLLKGVLQTPEDGRIKLYVIWRALALRNRLPTLFGKGQYLPLTEIEGPKKNHVCAFARISEDKTAITIVPRLIFGLLAGQQKLPFGTDVWGDTAIRLKEPVSASRFRDAFTGATRVAADGWLPLAAVFQDCPVALLEPA